MVSDASSDGMTTKSLGKLCSFYVKPKIFTNNVTLDPGDPVPLMPTIEEWLSRHDKYRISSSDVITASTIRHVRSDKDLHDFEGGHDSEGGDLQEKAIDILQSKDIKPRMAYLFKCEGQAKHVFMMETQETETDTRRWKEAALEVSKLFEEAGFSADRVTVEVMNRKLCIWNTSHVVTDDLVAQAMKGIASAVEKLVETDLEHKWTSVAYHMQHAMLGQFLETRPTVIVYCRPEIRHDFDKLYADLSNILEGASMKLFLEILPGTISCSYADIDSKPIRVEKIPSQPYNGASIGVSHDLTKAATHGGSLTIKLPDACELPIGLSCYHLISSPSDKKDDYGWQDAKEKCDSQKFMVEYPAAVDREYTRECIERELASEH